MAPPSPSAPALARGSSRTRQLQRTQWALGLLAMLFVLALWGLGALDFLERYTLDLRAQSFDAGSPQPSPAVTLLAIDENTQDQLGRWPWPNRGQRLGAVLDELRRAGVKVVAMDVMFQYENPDDPVFAEAIRAHGDVVLATAFSVRTERKPRALIDLLRDPALRALPRDEAVRLLTRKYNPELPPGVTRGEPFNEAARQYDQALTLLAAQAHGSIPDLAPSVQWPTSESPVPPVPALATNASDLANVTFDTYDPDFVVRRVPVLMRHEGRLWPSLGLAAALHYLGVPASDLKVENNTLIIPVPGYEPRRLPLISGAIAGNDAEGLFFLPWPRGNPPSRQDASKRPWQWQFWNRQTRTEGEYPLWRAYSPAQVQLSLAENLASIDKAVRQGYLATRVLMDEPAQEYERLAAAVFAVPPTDPAYAQAIEEGRLRGALRVTPDDDAFTPLFDRLQALLKQGAGLAQDQLDALLIGVESPDALTGDDRAQYELIRDARAHLASLEEAIVTGLSTIAGVRAEMKTRLGGKIVIVGWTAAGTAADFVATSIDPRTPGPHLHAAVASAVLTGFTRTFAPWWADALAILAMGAAGTLLGVRATVITAPLGTIALVIVWFLVAGAGLWGYLWIINAVAAPSAAAALGTGVVMLHRLIVEQRGRRKTEERFKAYLAPAVVDILVNNPHLDSMKPATRELAIMFTDLAGFTTTAERLGGQRTAEVLAKYLGRMTEIVQSTGATLDKYIGDAIMAFWGAPIDDPQHARHACQAAVAMINALDEMNAAGAFADAGQLVMRVGIATGEIMVGDFGNPPRNSSYTVIGDTANLASRLEGANKAFGSRILVNQATKEQAGEGFAFRLIGHVRVKGRAGAEAIYELLVPSPGAGKSDTRLREWVAATEAAIADYREARFQQCLACFERLRADFNDHALADLYLEHVNAWLAQPEGGPLPQGFDGTITLTEK